MRAISLQSGSAGNCIYVEAGGVRLLVDAGISGKQAELRLSEGAGVDIRRVDALLISHDHTDHISHAGIYARKFGLPVYLTKKTMAAAGRKYDLGKVPELKHFRSGDTIEFGDVKVETIPTLHDGADGSAFVIEHRGQRLGVLTDLGHAFDGLGAIVQSLDGVFLESNYDPQMLKRGPYPEFLKRRIEGPGGHLSNYESAGLLKRSKERLRWACLSHMSEHNNVPELALWTNRQVVGKGLELFCAGRRRPTLVFDL